SVTRGELRAEQALRITQAAAGRVAVQVLSKKRLRASVYTAVRRQVVRNHIGGPGAVFQVIGAPIYWRSSGSLQWTWDRSRRCAGGGALWKHGIQQEGAIVRRVVHPQAEA